MEVSTAFYEAEKEELQKLAQEEGVSVEQMVKTLIREAYANRLRTSPKIGTKTEIIDFSGPQNGLNDQE